jgi:HD-GYP domain-containing protein (c-di-GMP phosphodiesterase class II)
VVPASDYRDNETGGHVRRIGSYTAALADALGWGAERADDLRLTAPMHDVGKIGVPDGILLKPGPLSDKEFAVMKQHTVIGARILGGTGIRLLEEAREIALCHHERWDGGGYPGRAWRATRSRRPPGSSPWPTSTTP